MTTDINYTLADLLEVYRVRVTTLERALEDAESEVRAAEYGIGAQKERADRAEADAERHRQTVQERAKKNVELAEKVKKLEGAIDSLHIELQTERAAHTATRQAFTDHVEGQNTEGAEATS